MLPDREKPAGSRKAVLVHQQHTVPRLYLKGFADADGFLLRRTRSGLDDRVHINVATVHRDFYNFTTEDGEESDAVERWLGRDVENRAAGALRHVRAGNAPSPKQIPSLARFVVAQLLRTATNAARMEQIDRHLRPFLVMQSAMSKYGVDPGALSPETLDAIRHAAEQAWEQTDQRGPESRLRTMVRKFEELSDLLAKWSWSLLSSPRPVLITGDSPAVTVDLSAGWQGILPPGSPVHLPVSPRHLLVAEKHPLGTSGPLSPGLVKLVNSAIAREAHEAVFASPKSGWPLDLSLPQITPALSAPTVTWSSGSGDGAATALVYPDVHSPDIRDLLRALGAQDLE